MSDTPETKDGEELQEGTLVSHLVELRTRLIRASLSVLAIFACLAPFSDKVFKIVADPLMSQMSMLNGAEGEVGVPMQMIATQVASPFLVPFKTCMWVALFIAMPVVIYQVWAFVAPGLYKQEKRFAIPMVVSSILLFYAGLGFAYGVVFPLMFAFFTAAAPEGVAVMTDINSYLDFVLAIFFAFGLAFEVPIATVMLVWSGLTTPESLGKKRAYVFLGSFVVGMLLTPPDVISQTLLAVPVYLLYEVGILMSKLMVNKKADDSDSDTDSESEDEAT